MEHFTERELATKLFRILTEDEAARHFGEALTKIRDAFVRADLPLQEAEARAVSAGLNDLKETLAELTIVAQKVTELVGPFMQEPVGGKGQA